MQSKDTAMINFRLNLLKQDDKEIYDYLGQFDSPDFKAVLKGGKSNFIKTVLLSFIRKEKQEKEAVKILAEKKVQNEELAEIIEAKLDENQRVLLRALPELLTNVVQEALNGVVVAGRDSSTALQTSVGADVASSVVGTNTSEPVKSATKIDGDINEVGILPESSAELPDEAFDYFSGL